MRHNRRQNRRQCCLRVKPNPRKALTQIVDKSAERVSPSPIKEREKKELIFLSTYYLKANSSNGYNRRHNRLRIVSGLRRCA